jgi:glycosyltransferase involved in cell wall biosynthesis
MTAPRVSVIVPFLNEEPFLGEAIDSVRAQTLTDWELILVDDGSTDGSGAVADFATSDPRIRCLRHTPHRNLGKSVSRNAGLASSRAPYVLFLDADDVLRPDALRELAALLDRHDDAALAYGPLEWWLSWNSDARDFVEPLGIRAGTVVAAPRLLARYLAGRVPVPSGILVRREAALACGGFADEFRELYEDQVFLVRVLLRYGAVATDVSVYRYRRHAGASTSDSRPQELFDAARLRFHRWTTDYFRSMKVRDPRLWSALAVARLPSVAPRFYKALRSVKQSVARRGRR